MTYEMIIGILLLLGILALGAAAWLWLRHDNTLGVLDSLAPSKTHQDKLIFALGLATLIGLTTGAFERDERITAHMAQLERIRAAEAAGYLHPDRARAVVNINDCGPRTAGDTGQVIFAIETQPDGKHISRGCSRISDPYTIKSAAK